MPINAHPEYLAAENEYLAAQTTEQKILKLKKMIAVAPKHKGAENLLKQLKTRLKKLKYSKEKETKQSKHKGEGIKKEDMQAIIIGLTNSGKSTSLFFLYLGIVDSIPSQIKRTPSSARNASLYVLTASAELKRPNDQGFLCSVTSPASSRTLSSNFRKFSSRTQKSVAAPGLSILSS